MISSQRLVKKSWIEPNISDALSESCFQTLDSQLLTLSHLSEIQSVIAPQFLITTIIPAITAAKIPNVATTDPPLF